MKETAFAKKLRTSHGLSLGVFGDTTRAPNGEPYIVLRGIGGEDEATEAFTSYCKECAGSQIHWRIMPEIGESSCGSYFYMRLLIEP
jgi:hypothetical protein